MLDRIKYSLGASIAAYIATSYAFKQYQRQKKEGGAFFDKSKAKEKIAGAVVGSVAGYVVGPKITEMIAGADRKEYNSMMKALRATGIGAAYFFLEPTIRRAVTDKQESGLEQKAG